ncbi:gamma-tubulin complex component protein [Spinellus fusiger]|nr:gamma-tubulin complex component protein [Spinellus fusiger]
MLHELLFVLSGYSGGVFLPTPPHTPTTYAIPPDFPLLHSTERASLNRLGQLGFVFGQLQQFITTVKDLGRPSPTLPHGAYVQAVVSTLESILNDYRKDILAMEKRILNKHDEAGANVVPIALLTSSLSRWELLLPALWRFVLLLQQEPARYHGCCLLDLLMDQAHTGMSELRDAMEKMIVRLHDVLYRQLACWMVYGEWTDPDEEFFIVRTPHTASLDTPHSQTAGWQRHYSLAKERIPAHLSLSLAESILFIGKAIATVNSASDPSTSRQHSHYQHQRPTILVPEEMKRRHLQLLLSLHSSVQQQHEQHEQHEQPRASPWIHFSMTLQKVVQQIRRSTAEWLFSQVLVGKDGLQCYLDSFRHIFFLGYGDLSLNLIDECTVWRRRSLSLRSSLAPSHSLPTKHTREETSIEERVPLSKSALVFRHQELNALLAKAGVGTEAEDGLKGYRLEWIDADDVRAVSFYFTDLLLVNGRCLLTYKLEWPIDLFMSASDLVRYNELWSFLIGLKNVQISLSGLWITRSPKKKQQNQLSLLSSTATEDEGEYKERIVWRLRFSMLFWVDILWNHVQTNVINARYQRLMTTIAPSFLPKDARDPTSHPALDFEEIQMAHTEYLEDIMRGCLLLSGSCAKTMHEILRLCLDFCELVEEILEEGLWKRTKKRRTEKIEATNVWSKPEWSRPRYEWMEKIDSIEQNFFHLTRRFFGLVSHQAQDTKASGHLDLLLMQLDCEDYSPMHPLPTHSYA